MTKYADLLPEEVQLDGGSELLYRQITPPLMDKGKPSSTAFGPATADEGKPSFARESKTTPQDARDWHTANAAKPSLGVWACSVEEVDAANTRAVDDSGVPPQPQQKVAPGHCYVDYRHLDKKDERKVRSALLAKALAREEIATDGTGEAAAVA
ncbi:hypothetical protein SAT01_36910 [Sinomonas atrocyanea]|jgi:hypothetical protein|uniref:hypothetical protein n=1 Tax=Sinomonas atrocyanea TaxID=37927 RepID=UPI00114413C5|nr:hypothetical protein [Sinomonas atrocyanea]GEB66243.1 hypothetical protein SAT01_36910 [Sinomonas atrocyanea]GGG80122.1 hypothetical protein GCM10007172_36700 [Sinomonas atrocyanea]